MAEKLTSTKRYNDKGQVAVLVSHGYGAGWSTWNPDCDGILFAPEIVDAVLAEASAEAIVEIANRLWPEGYFGGAGGLTVHWVKPGSLFKIDEYDGAESIEFRDADDWIVA